MGQQEARLRTLTPLEVNRQYDMALARMDHNRGDHFLVRVVEQQVGTLPHDGSADAVMAVMRLQDRIRETREARIPVKIREARMHAETDLKRTRTLLAVRRTLPAWDDSDTERARDNTVVRHGIWDSNRQSIAV
jgi:hypothetical protein